MGCGSSTLEDGDNNKQFRIIWRLGSGAFGEVKLAEDLRTGDRGKVAIKYIPRHKIDEYVEGEVLNHQKIVHWGVIQILEVFYTLTHLCIVLEYAEKGTLLEHVNQQPEHRLPETMARRYFQQVVLAVHACHKQDIVNRDLKLENVLLHTTGRGSLVTKICDFGLSKDENIQSLTHTFCGTQGYLAPEVEKVKHEGGMYDGKRADAWSCGVILYTMLYGKHPFDIQPRRHNTSYVCKFPSEITVSSQAKNLISKILVVDPLKRASVRGIMDDPWFKCGLPDEKTQRAMMPPAKCKQTRDELLKMVQKAQQMP